MDHLTYQTCTSRAVCGLQLQPLAFNRIFFPSCVCGGARLIALERSDDTTDNLPMRRMCGIAKQHFCFYRYFVHASALHPQC